MFISLAAAAIKSDEQRASVTSALSSTTIQNRLVACFIVSSSRHYQVLRLRDLRTNTEPLYLLLCPQQQYKAVWSRVLLFPAAVTTKSSASAIKGRTPSRTSPSSRVIFSLSSGRRYQVLLLRDSSPTNNEPRLLLLDEAGGEAVAPDKGIGRRGSTANTAEPLVTKRSDLATARRHDTVALVYVVAAAAAAPVAVDVRLTPPPFLPPTAAPRCVLGLRTGLRDNPSNDSTIDSPGSHCCFGTLVRSAASAVSESHRFSQCPDVLPPRDAILS